MPLEKIRGDKVFNGLAVADADEGLMEAFLRLMKLLDTPDDIPMPSLITIREIYARILLSPVVKHVRQLCTLGTQSNQITRAVDWLKDNFRKPFKIDEFAKYVHMSPTTFHRYFRKITSVSPIQYQKNLYLHETRRIMISDNETVANAARSGLRKPHAVRPRIQTLLRQSAQTRCRSLARARRRCGLANPHIPQTA